MIKIFPVLKSIFSAHLYFPFKVIDVKGQNKCITVTGTRDEKIVRNIQDVKALYNQCQRIFKRKRSVFTAIKSPKSTLWFLQ